MLDLRYKVQPPAAGIEADARPAGTERADAEVVAALMGLGYSQQEATAAADRLPKDGQTPLEERVRAALAFFAR